MIKQLERLRQGQPTRIDLLSSAAALWKRTTGRRLHSHCVLLYRHPLNVSTAAGLKLLHDRPEDAVMSDEGPCILKLGEAMLAGEIEYRKGNFETAFELLREAVRYVRHSLA